MRKDGQITREKILDNANTLIMDAGFGGTTVDEVIEKSGITKGAFFYHFKTKEDLARAIVERYVAQDCTLLDTIIANAEKQSSDPVDQLLFIIDQYIAALEIDPHPDGCLYASFCYESGLLDDATLKPIQNAILHWRDRISTKIKAATTAKKPTVPIEPLALADCFLSTFEGGFVLARSLKKPQVIVEQLKQFRTFITALFPKP